MPAASIPLSLPFAEIAAAHLQAFRTLCALAADLTNPAQARLAATTLLSIAVPDTVPAARPSTSPERSDGSLGPAPAVVNRRAAIAAAPTSSSPIPQSPAPSPVPSSPIHALDRYLARTRGTESPAGRLLARAGARAAAVGTG